MPNQIVTHLPHLRRYARALTGSQALGDACVEATLEAMLADPALFRQAADDVVALYAIFTRQWNSDGQTVASVRATGHEGAAQARLARIAPVHRQALLLRALEEFPVSGIARILGETPESIATMIDEALAEIDAETASNVLIIENEPLIAMQLETLVSDLGHQVVATAAASHQAIECMKDVPVDLVLADIHLADDDSGLIAVEELLKGTSTPVIFITAYPERLLTGQRPEPAYLITKPFREATVRTAISQALFFGSTAPVG